jgi:hypothetical protein
VKQQTTSEVINYVLTRTSVCKKERGAHFCFTSIACCYRVRKLAVLSQRSLPALSTPTRGDLTLLLLPPKNDWTLGCDAYRFL